ncbi:MAG: hypothetical protein HQ582_00270 [Planctomycetes bacterium]|nr:hypothetical protein [Planctomycetota bacterium]
MASGYFSGTCQLSGDMRLGAGAVTNTDISASAEIARTKLAQDTAKKYIVPWSSFRVHDAIQTLLPSPSANDDLGFPATQTFGTVPWYLDTHDLKTTTNTLYARCCYELPAEYDSGETITLRIRGGMKTTIADGSATIDASVYKADRDGAVGADLCSTAAQSINNLANADKDFTITPSGLAAGDILDCRVALAVVDTATGTAVIGEVLEVAFLLDIRG